RNCPASPAFLSSRSRATIPAPSPPCSAPTPARPAEQRRQLAPPTTVPPHATFELARGLGPSQWLLGRPRPPRCTAPARAASSVSSQWLLGRPRPPRRPARGRKLPSCPREPRPPPGLHPAQQ